MSPHPSMPVIDASHSQTLLGGSSEGVASAVSTAGNPDCQLILRSGDDRPNLDINTIKVTRIPFSNPTSLPTSWPMSPIPTAERTTLKYPLSSKKSSIDGPKAILQPLEQCSKAPSSPGIKSSPSPSTNLATASPSTTNASIEKPPSALCVSPLQSCSQNSQRLSVLQRSFGVLKSAPHNCP